MIVGSIWAVLGLAATRDAGAIRRAYAARLKIVHPEDDPEGFQKLRAAYEQAIALARANVPLPADGDDQDDEDEDDDGEGDFGAREEAPAALELVTLEPSQAETSPPPPRESKRPRAPAEDRPQNDYDRLWSRLESLVAASQTPPEFELADVLTALLRHPKLEDIGEHMTAESRLANLIARGFPRTDPMIQPAAERFGWADAVKERYPNPTVVRVVRRGVEVAHLKALAALEALARQPEAPPTFELDRALNAVTTTALNDPELFRHTESELCRMILTYAPRLDDLIGTIAGRLSWDQRGYDGALGPVLRRRDTLLARRRLEARSHRLHQAWELVQRPPSPFEALRQLISPRRYGRVRQLMGALEKQYPDILATLPADATAAWRRYFRVAIINPFTVAVLVALALLVTTCQMQVNKSRAEDVAKYYPAAALKAGISGRVTLRCRADDEGTLHGYDAGVLRDCSVLKEDPAGHDFGQAALKISRDGRLSAQSGIAFAPGTSFDAKIDFYSGVSASIDIQSGEPEDTNADPRAEAQPSTGFTEVGGKVTLHCFRDAHDKLSQCSVVAENPSGQGLGDYAVMYAEDGVIKPPPPLTPGATGWVQFQTTVRLEKAATPAPMVIVPQRFTPSATPAWPSGSAILECRRTPSDHLSACRALWESPRGAGAQAAAASAAGRIHVLSPPPSSPRLVRFQVRLGPHPPPIPPDALGPGPTPDDAPALRPEPPTAEFKLKPVSPEPRLDGPPPSAAGPDQVPQWVRDARKAQSAAGDRP